MKSDNPSIIFLYNISLKRTAYKVIILMQNGWVVELPPDDRKPVYHFTIDTMIMPVLV